MAGNTDRGGRREGEIHPLPPAPGNAPGLGSLQTLPAANTHLLFPATLEDTGRAAEIISLCGGLVLSITQELTGCTALKQFPPHPALSSVIWHCGPFYWSFIFVIIAASRAEVVPRIFLK